ncbi:MAG: glycoside hydrolase family 9 protein [Bacteroidota bacterium]
MSLRKLSICWGVLIFTTHVLLAQTPSSFIHVDQFGYLTLANKVAILSDPQEGINANLSYSPGPSIELHDAQSDAIVWTGTPQVWNGGITYDRAGDRGWWLDFSNFTSPGNYYLLDPTNNERSAVFSISDNAYDGVMTDAGRAFFYNRCNSPKASPYAESNWTDSNNFLNALQDGECSYVNDRENASLRRDLSGGWFDAGDYNKYVSFTYTTLSDLLWAYRESPEAFSDNWNIPESGNGLPDLLDEIKWEIDWLLKMTNPDGSVINKMGSISYNDNAAAPPSNNFDRRYYGPTCTSASITASVAFAHGAEVFSEFPSMNSYVNQLTTAAENTFAFWLAAKNNNALEYDCDDGTIKSGDADMDDQNQKEAALTAAIHLFELTGNATYSNYLVNSAAEAEFLPSGFWGIQDLPLTSALLHYTTLPNADINLSNQIISAISLESSNNWNRFWGMDTDGLYRAYMPDWSYGWGSNQAISRYAILNSLLIRHNINMGVHESYRQKAVGMLHYIHGVNPLGLVYLSGMEGRGADRGIQEIYHTWFNEGTDWDNSTTSLYGPAPGFLAGGPNRFFTIGSIAPPAGQPMMKAYKDWNTGWNGSYNENSWEITEPAIYYQAAYIRNLAAQMVLETALPVVYASPLSAYAQGKDVLLRWEVEQEINAAYYEIEHLGSQNRWLSIGRIEARGLPRYQFIHQHPFTGSNNYRLRQVDIDGSFRYSNIATVHFSNAYDAIQLYPNPVGNEFIQMNNLPTNTSIRIYNSLGQMVLSQSPAQSQRITIDLGGLPEGWYGVELIRVSEGRIWNGQFVKQ